MPNRLVPVIMVFVLCAFLSCTNDRSPRIRVDPDSIFLDYQALGDEESGNIALKLQFRAGGPDEPAIRLKEPARVELDGQVLLPDSSKFNGPYYEVIRSAAEFSGQHRIVFTAIGGKKYTALFDFPIISLENKIPGTVDRSDLIFMLNGLKKGDKIHVMLTDTSFYGRGIERVETPDSNRVLITKQDLLQLRNGPIQLEFLREEDRDPGETMAAGGRFYMAYGLKREFILQDSVR